MRVNSTTITKNYSERKKNNAFKEKKKGNQGRGGGGGVGGRKRNLQTIFLKITATGRNWYKIV